MKQPTPKPRTTMPAPEQPSAMKVPGMTPQRMPMSRPMAVSDSTRGELIPHPARGTMVRAVRHVGSGQFVKRPK